MDFNNAAKNPDMGLVDYDDFGRLHLDLQYVAGRRTESNRSLTHNAIAQKESYPKFCSNCDNQIKIDDRFCSKCGAASRGE